MRFGLSHQEHALRPEKTVMGRFFAIQRLSQAETLRFSCIISKKVAQKAVERNRIRRRVRALFREAAKPGLFVIRVKKQACDAEFQELRKEITSLIMKLG